MGKSCAALYTNIIMFSFLPEIKTYSSDKIKNPSRIGLVNHSLAAGVPFSWTVCLFSLYSECLNHQAVHTVSRSCYGKQRCTVAVDNHTFRDPCMPGTRKYLTVLYACGK